MTSATDDSILRQDMPQALHKVNGAAKLLEEAAKLSRIDPMSKVARSKLIEGSRLILQGKNSLSLFRNKRGLCLKKCSCETLQNLPYSIQKPT